MEFTGEKVDALRGSYIRRLTAVIIYHVPAFWRVAVAVFSGKFAKVINFSIQYTFYRLVQNRGYKTNIF